MKKDYVLPDGNETEFVKQAELLGFEEICFLYPPVKRKEDTQNRISQIEQGSNIKITFGYFINHEKRKKNSNGAQVFYMGSKISEAIEKRASNTVLATAIFAKKDFMHHRASGLNHVLCRLAKEKNIQIAFSLFDIIHCREDRHVRMGRIIQNRRLCKRAGNSTVTGSFARRPCEMRAQADIEAVFKCLGLQ